MVYVTEVCAFKFNLFLISEEQDDTTNIIISSPQPPQWQRVPQEKNRKRKKLNQTPSPEGLQTSNSFGILPIETDEDIAKTKIKKQSKPPPIILYGVEDVGKLTELLKTVVEREQFTYKIISRHQIRISCLDVEVYKKLISIVREKGLIGHTFTRKDQKNYRIVIRNLHHSTPIDEIIEAVESTGNKVAGEIINIKYGPEKIPTSTFFVNVLPGPKNKDLKSLRYIYHQSVIIEDPKKKKTIVQCQRCQQYGHSKNNCMRPYRCVKCAQQHKTSDCTKTDRTTPAKCALCQGAHPANYKGCEVYKEILARKLAPQLHQKTKEPHNVVHVEENIGNKPKRTYAATIRKNTSPPSENLDDPPNWQKKKDKVTDTEKSTIEKMLIKQNEQFQMILQQVSTLMQLMTKLLEKLTK